MTNWPGVAIPDGKLTVVPNAVEAEMIAEPRAKDAALVAELGLGERVVLGFIGSFYHYEGLDLLLDALPAIRARDPRVAVLLVGGGPMDAALRATVAARGLGDCVRFTGRVPHEQVKRYYDLMDFLVFPRRRMRLTDLTTPLKPVEAMAEGRLVIASDVGGHRELLRDGVTGFLFAADDGDALARRVLEAVAATGTHAAMREAGRRFVETERVWPVSAANYKPVYEALLAGRSARYTRNLIESETWSSSSRAAARRRGDPGGQRGAVGLDCFVASLLAMTSTHDRTTHTPVAAGTSPPLSSTQVRVDLGHKFRRNRAGFLCLHALRQFLAVLHAEHERVDVERQGVAMRERRRGHAEVGA